MFIFLTILLGSLSSMFGSRAGGSARELGSAPLNRRASALHEILLAAAGQYPKGQVGLGTTHPTVVSSSFRTSPGAGHGTDRQRGLLIATATSSSPATDLATSRASQQS